MSFVQINDYEEPMTFRKFKKSIFNGTEWEERIFYETRTNTQAAAQWLQKTYGEGCYCQSWWGTFNAVCMSEKVYTHYALSVL